MLFIKEEPSEEPSTDSSPQCTCDIAPDDAWPTAKEDSEEEDDIKPTLICGPYSTSVSQ